jgi:hypothetical protein
MKPQSIFFYIAKTRLTIPEKLFEPTGPDILQIFLFSKFKSVDSKKNKFSHLNDAMNNIFLTEAQKETYVNHFCHFQKTLFALSRFAYMYRFKKSKTVVTQDLGMNPIDICNKDTIIIIQNKNKYLFRINDLINVIETSITNSYLLFADPLVSKNPFNNVPFNKSTLYNIYFFMRSNSLVMPELIHKFFLTNFNLQIYQTEYEYLIREHSIKKYIKYSDDDTLFECTKDMLYEYGHSKMNIDPTFPRKRLSLIMRPYLELYYQSRHSLINVKKLKARVELIHKLNKFVNFNPMFGRKVLKIERQWSSSSCRHEHRTLVTYNDSHILFEHQGDEQLFLESHLVKV